MIDLTQFPWRAPLSADWLARWQALDATVRGGAVDAATYAAAQGVASQRLGVREQVKMENLAARLVAADGDASMPRFRLGLIGNRTLDLLLKPLAAAGLARGVRITAQAAPYDSATAFAFGQTEPFGQALDAVVVVLDEDAFTRPQGLLDVAGEDAALAAAERHLDRVAAAIRDRGRATPIIATLPDAAPRIASADIAIAGSRARFIARLNGRIADGARDGRWLVWDLAALAARIGGDRWHDAAAFHHAKSPFAIALSPLVADRLAALVAALCGKAGRALVLDLDNTLWGGEIGDDGVAGLRLGAGSAEGEAFVAFQHFVRDLRRRGVVLAVCSKNNDAIAREPFATHPDMVLKQEEFAVFRAGWDDKATGVAAIAQALNLNSDALVFVDDNPFERARVRGALPGVGVPELGTEPADFAALIAASGCFEHLLLTGDDLGRSASYAARAALAAGRDTAASYGDYLKSLDMVLTVAPFDAVGRARIVQLIGKSNQFNLTTRRYNEAEVAALEQDGDCLCWQARLKDSFGDHGMIAVVIVRKAAKVWTIDTWLQSCRVLERGVEQSLMNQLFAQARAQGIETITGDYIATARNGMVADFYDRMGFTPQAAGRYARAVKAFEPFATQIAVEQSDRWNGEKRPAG